MNHYNMLGRIAIVLIEEHAQVNSTVIDYLCQGMPCGTTACHICPFDSIENFNQFKQDYQDDNS